MLPHANWIPANFATILIGLKKMPPYFRTVEKKSVFQRLRPNEISLLLSGQNWLKSIAAFRWHNERHALSDARCKSTLNDMNPNYLFGSVFDMWHVPSNSKCGHLFFNAFHLAAFFPRCFAWNSFHFSHEFCANRQLWALKNRQEANIVTPNSHFMLWILFVLLFLPWKDIELRTMDTGHFVHRKREKIRERGIRYWIYGVAF